MWDDCTLVYFITHLLTRSPTSITSQYPVHEMTALSRPVVKGELCHDELCELKPFLRTAEIGVEHWAQLWV